ncbi:MAG: GNAT family protein [Methanobacteriota archaeon]
MKPGTAKEATVQFRSIEEPEIVKIHGYQNGDCREELSGIFRFEEPWAPMSRAQIKEKLDEQRKERRSAFFGLFLPEGEFVGLASFTSRWDPWCPRFEIIVWPECRRKGFGRSAAQNMLSKIFGDHLSNATSTSVPEWSKPARAFVESLGFSACGRMRRAGIRGGKFYDMVCYDLLKREYLAGKKGVG